MADSKITALTAISTVDPTADPLVIVDVSDTSMAASGTTKKSTINQLLGAGGTATLASATITGDLTVDTSTLKVNSSANRVGVLTASPESELDVRGLIAVRGTPTFPSTGVGLEIYHDVSNTSSYIQSYDRGGSAFYNLSYKALSHIFQLGSGTAMTLNSTGLGVGDSPASNTRLTVAAASRLADTTGQAYIRSTDAQAQDIGAQLTFGGLFNASSHYAFGGIAGRKENSTSGNVAGYLDFLTTTSGGSLTSRMRIDSSGNWLVGTTSNPNSSRAAVKTASVTSALSLNSVTGDTAQELFVINKFDSNSTTSQVFARFTNNNGAAGSGQINGNGANACAFGSFSDARLKENIVSLPSQLANILSLRPVEFDYKDGSGHQIGFVAQEIQEVYADTVAEQNGFLTVTGWSKTEARLVSAIKELAAKVQALEAKLA